MADLKSAVKAPMCPPSSLRTLSSGLLHSSVAMRRADDSIAKEDRVMSKMGSERDCTGINTLRNLGLFLVYPLDWYNVGH